MVQTEYYSSMTLPPPILMSLVSNIWLILSQSCCDRLFHCVCLANLVKTITVASSAHYSWFTLSLQRLTGLH